MSYNTVKNNIVDIISALGYREAKVTNFEDVAANEIGNVCIVNAVAGILEPEGETLVTHIYDKQVWEIKIGYKKSGQNSVINRDDMHRERVKLIRDLDDPDKWRDYVKIQKYQSWEVEELENYFLLTITVEVIDSITYA